MKFKKKSKPSKIIEGDPIKAKAVCILLIVPPLNSFINFLRNKSSENKFEYILIK